MRVPIRKPGKYTHHKPDPNLTRFKYNELQKQLERTKKKLPFLREEVKRLALDGDFSENAAYQIAKGRLRGVNQRVLDIESLLKRAEIINPQNNERVQLGHFVTVENEGEIKTFQILGSEEVDLSQNIISHNSPIGAVLMGKKVGDEVKIRLSEKNKRYKILEIKS